MQKRSHVSNLTRDDRIQKILMQSFYANLRKMLMFFKPVAVIYESEEEFQGGFTDDSLSEISPNKDDATNSDEVPLNESECNVSNTNSLNIGTVLIKESPKVMIKLEENNSLSEIDSTASKSLDKLSKSKVAENESPSDDGATPLTESLEDLSKGRVACALCDEIVQIFERSVKTYEEDARRV